MNNAAVDSERSELPLGTVAFIGLGTILYEILLTRIFSVTMWYHFAFVAISLALFGLAASGAVVTAFRKTFNPENAREWIARAATGFGLSIPVCFVANLHIPFIPFHARPGSAIPYLLFAGKFLVLAIPFFLSGLVIALAFTHYPRRVHRTYLADLVGGGVGCIVAVLVLQGWSGPSGVLLSSVFGLLAALLVHARDKNRRATLLYAAGIVLVLVFVAANEIVGWVRIIRVKSYDPNRAQVAEKGVIYEKWHPVSRVAVCDLQNSTSPRPWFYSPPFPHSYPSVMEVTNDGGARTYIFPKMSASQAENLFEGDLSDLVYAATDKPKVLVVGVGGGKDVLSALANNASQVVGVEINPVMVEVVQQVFSHFSGAPYNDPRVAIAIDEGRNFIATHNDRYDVIKISVTDTWAASAVGAYALTENYLYTVEAIREYLEHLEPDGFLSITRWYPIESVRLTALLAHTLRDMGISSPEEHILIARNKHTCTAIVKRTSFSGDERSAIAARAERVGLRCVAGCSAEGNWPLAAEELEIDHLHRAVMGADSASISEKLAFRIDPPTDDRPFFFNSIDFSQARKGEFSVTGWGTVLHTLQHGRGMALLIGLLEITTVATVLFVLVPLVFSRAVNLHAVPGSVRICSNLYFLMLGLGYMLMEIPLLQQLILFLGHPVYSLTVVLATLLISSGLGSLLAERLGISWRRAVFGVFPVLVGVVLGTTTILPSLLHRMIGFPLGFRVVMTVLLLAPIGLVLGMPFPIGIRQAHRIDGALVPWAWAVNGAASVTAPVLAMILAIQWGFSRAMWVGGCTYILAAVFLLGFGLLADRQPKLERQVGS